MRGGARDGAGRPALAEKERRQRVTFYVDPETADRIRELRKKGVKLGNHLDRWISEM